MRLATFYRLAQKPLTSPLRFRPLRSATVKAHPFLAAAGQVTQKVTYKTAQLAPATQLVLLGSPEAFAITTGLLAWQKQALRFLPARLHTGPKRGLDAAAAAFQALQLEPVKQAIDRIESLDDRLVLVDLLREGQKAQTPEALYYLTGSQPPNVLVSIHHVPDTQTPLGRRAEVAPPNLEGVDTQKVTTLLLSDPTASGVNQFSTLEYFRGRLPKLNQVIILAPHLSQYAGLALARYLEKVRLPGLMIGFGALLDSLPPLMYFSPTPVHDVERFVDPRHQKLIQLLYGPAASRLCIAGNWTAMFLAPQVGLEWFERELKENHLTLAQVKKRCPSLSQLKRLGFTPEELTPVSTYLDAVNAGQLPQLRQALTDS